MKKARELYESLRKEEPGKKEYRVNLVAFVMRAWAEDIRDATSSKATEAISGLIDRSCYFLLYGDIDAAIARERLAQYVYKKYMQANADTKARTTLAPYAKIKETVVKRYLNSPNPMIAKIFKAKLEQLKARQNGSSTANKKSDNAKK